jgi:hypothetical protein
MSEFKFTLPEINIENFSNEKYVKKIANYLVGLDEQLRYMFENLDEDNLTDHFIETLMARRLVVTNDTNTILADPDVGFEISKGTTKQFYIDIATGDIIYGGKMIGGSIQSDNYKPEISGMLINLTDGSIDSTKLKINPTGGLVQSGNYVADTNGMKINLGDGTLDTKYFKLDPLGKVKITDGVIDIITASDASNVIKLTYGTKTVILRPTSIQFTNTTTDKTVTLSNTDTTAGLTLTGSGGAVSITPDGIYMLGKPITCGSINPSNGVNGSFLSADGKMVTVTDGIITGIV